MSGSWTIPNWLGGSNALGGGSYLGNSQWQAGTPLAAGADSGFGVKLPVAYDSSRDTHRWDFSTRAGAESNWARVHRWAADAARGGVAPDEAFRGALARLKRTYEQAGLDWGRSGFDLAHVNWGEGHTGGHMTPEEEAKRRAQQGQQGQGAGGSQTGRTAGNIALMQDPDQFYDRTMEGAGYDPRAKVWFMDQVRRTLSPLFQRYITLQGFDGSKPVDRLGDIMGSLSGKLGGGNFFGGIADEASRAVAPGGGAASYLAKAQPEVADAYLRNVLAMVTAGSNPLVADVTASEYDNAAAGSRRQAVDYLNDPSRGTPPDLYSWLMGQPEYAWLFQNGARPR